MRNLKTYIISILSVLVIATIFYPKQQAQAVTEEAWDNAVTVYGAALENNPSAKETTSNLLGTKNSDKTTYVNAEDLNKYLNMQSSNDVLKSSIRITKTSKGSGLNLTINQDQGQITKVTEDTYKNALMTAGIKDADVTIASSEDVTGESALAGVYKAFEAQGESIDSNRTQVAQEELSTINEISEENKGQEGFSQSQLNKTVAESKQAVAEKSGNVSVTEITNIVNQKIEDNGLTNIINENQVNKIVNVIDSAQKDGIFDGENAKDFIKNSKDYVNDIVKSDDFKNAKKKAEDLGNNIKDKLQDEGLWDKIVNAIKDIFNSIANLFK
ncbi:hypothetical protein AXY37_08825 [Mammaliicoccus lentus]|uniref:DUF1002 domain-containing protein n=1 Tax=Mammaliicoccus TaxID=2803850 RepID=UPI0007D8F98F|nr:DUF1002 domain-containing protein [Mammaliicoccus lentus]MBF0793054.1 DUF1002 domain-containing protein [Mammaliicoccus lentus]MBW0761088.1 DUF1002 domain-containing protein [Mammaliicoccus lentus]MBW0770758.1 DUF1002 domain-containing protein [Mammaliicoccus lentus]MCR1873427.1 DUF1002 domain-containing protein [Mammaliicoccus lentus]MEB5685347.1 DUF1002 domain-containing protein [Mammaliicoccus lentus]